jgi:hypothetical protein
MVNRLFDKQLFKGNFNHKKEEGVITREGPITPKANLSA